MSDVQAVGCGFTCDMIFTGQFLHFVWFTMTSEASIQLHSASFVGSKTSEISSFLGRESRVERIVR